MDRVPTVCAIIPAKAVSKRILGKNLKDLCGKPMIAYILESAKGAVGVDRVIVTTESEEIKAVAISYGAEVPFMRPIDLTQDHVTSQQVVLHAILELEKQEYHPDYVMLLYPTSPLLSKERIEEAIRMAVKNNSDSVISGTYDKGHYWKMNDGKWHRFFPKDIAVNSQDAEPLFKENGAIYLTKTALIAENLVADPADVLIMGEDETIDVDYPRDFERVEEILLQKAA